MKAKPFVKWVGGKGQLLEQLEALLPADFDQWENVTYIEPFVGGGAMLFYMLQTHSNIQFAIINDINKDLTTCYKVVQKNPDALVDSLQQIQREYYALQTEESRKQFFMLMRDEFNTKNLDPIRNTTLFFFLNRTCFNGLYRVNKSGLFNVPFGRYETPTICDPETIYADNELLQKVEIMTGDYQQTFAKAQGNTLFYFDPPYRPLSNTSSFNDYVKEEFNDFAQKRLKEFCDKVTNAGYKFMLSNSDCKDGFFDDLYVQYVLNKVLASRSVNANPLKRGKLTELLISNFNTPVNQAIQTKINFESEKSKTNPIMYLNQSSDALVKLFVEHLLPTNRGFNYYVDWKNVDGFQEFLVEIHALDILIGCRDDDEFGRRFFDLVSKLPKTVLLFPFLFGLAKDERDKLYNGKHKLTVVIDEIDSPDNLTYAFPKRIGNLSNEQIQYYYNFFVQMGLKNLFQMLIEKSTLDYIVGVLVGMDSNGRKNRGGQAFELACLPVFESLCYERGLTLLIQKKFIELQKYGFVVSQDIASRKADFIVVDKESKKAINFEVNFYNGTGSKPEEIIDSYINRQNDLHSIGIEFSLVTDGQCWSTASNQLQKGFRHLNYLQNFYMLKHGMLAEILDKVFEN